jgi:hypothetical protein
LDSVTRHSVRVGDERLHPMVEYLTELENPFDPDQPYAFDPDELIRFALTASDYWANRALDWLTFGCRLRRLKMIYVCWSLTVRGRNRFATERSASSSSSAHKQRA